MSANVAGFCGGAFLFSAGWVPCARSCEGLKVSCEGLKAKRFNQHVEPDKFLRSIYKVCI